MAVVSLVRTLSRLALCGGRGVPEGTEATLEQASASQWRRCFSTLKPNRLQGPFGGCLAQHGLMDAVRPEAREYLERMRIEQARRNDLRMVLFAELLRELRGLGVEPVLLKSSLLVALLHPEQAHNQMGDIDAWVPIAGWHTVIDHLEASGYARQHDIDRPTDFLHPSGNMLLDIHHTFELFNHVDMSELVVDREATFPGMDTVRVFEPNAMVAHLVYHLNEHRPSFGYLLRWLLDVGFAMQAWGDELEMSRLRHLLPNPLHVFWVLRAARFLHQELGVDTPRGLERAATDVDPFTLEEVLRSQRAGRWPMNELRGWVRMGLCLAGRRELGRRAYPWPTDPLLWRRDRRREQLAIAKAQAHVRPSVAAEHDAHATLDGDSREFAAK